MSTLITKITETVARYNKLGDTASQKELLEVRKELSTSLFALRQIAKERKKDWKRAEYFRKKASAQMELDSIGEKMADGKLITSADRKNKAMISAHVEYNAEIDAESDYDEFRATTEGIKQILNTIAAELKDYEQGH